MNNQNLQTQNFHILVIDDDQKLRSLLKQFLENNGFRVSDAEDTTQAKKIMESLVFDLLVIDIMMPGQSGLDFLTGLIWSISIRMETLLSAHCSAYL